MSTDKDNHKSDEMKVEEKGDAKPDIKKAEANDVEKEVKDENDEKSSDNESEQEPEKVKKDSPKKAPSKAKETKKEEKSEEDEDENDEEKDGDEEDDEDEDEDENDGGKNKKAADKDGKVPLLDQPLQVSGARERKKVERFSVDKSELKETSPVEIPEGKGVALGNIGIIENNISKNKGDDLKKFHQVLFGRPGKATLIKKNIRKFNGFDFDKDSEQYEKKKASLAKLDVKYLRDLAGILDLVKGGAREDLATRLLDFLMEPKGAGTTPAAPTKGGLTKGGRPKRSAAAKANNKGYSDGSDEDDEDRAPRSRRANKGRRPNLKDESSSEDEKAKKEASENEEEKGSDVDMEVETPSSDESDDPKSKKKRAPPPKAPAKKSKKKSTPAKKEKPTPKKRKAESEDEDEEDESSEDDQPLVKKTKTPPTDDDIKTYVKEILEGANLEEITMKTVCKQVYSHYPEFDLAHKKDFIKTTVKSLIST